MLFQGGANVRGPHLSNSFKNTFLAKDARGKKGIVNMLDPSHNLVSTAVAVLKTIFFTEINVRLNFVAQKPKSMLVQGSEKLPPCGYPWFLRRIWGPSVKYLSSVSIIWYGPSYGRWSGFL